MINRINFKRILNQLFRNSSKYSNSINPPKMILPSQKELNKFNKNNYLRINRIQNNNYRKVPAPKIPNDVIYAE